MSLHQVFRILVFNLVLLPMLFGVVEAGTYRGRVIDAVGNLIPGATVRLWLANFRAETFDATGLQEQSTDHGGWFEFRDLRLGPYVVDVALTGFRSARLLDDRPTDPRFIEIVLTTGRIADDYSRIFITVEETA